MKVAGRELSAGTRWRLGSYLTLWLLALCVMPQSAWAKGAVSVAIEGVQGALADNVRAFLSLANQDVKSNDADTVQRLYQRAPTEIRDALQPYGYYQPSIESHLKRDGDHWQATFHIDRGPPTTIRKLEVKVVGPGRNDARFKKVLSRNKMKVGERLIQSQYKSLKAALRQAAYNGGFVQSHFKQSTIRVYPKQRRAEVALVLETGPYYYFGQTTIHQKILNPKFVARYVPFQPGDRFDPSKLLDLQFALSGTDYFKNVEVNVEKNQAKPVPGSGGNAVRVPISVDTTPEQPQKYTAGIGYGTDTGPRVRGSISLRRVNREGHSFETSLYLSQIAKQITARYKIPVRDVRTDNLAFSGSYIDKKYGDGRSRREQTDATLNTLWHDWHRALYLKFDREHYEFSGQSQFAYELAPGVTLSRTVADNLTRPRRGWSASLDVHGANSAVASSLTYLQEEVTGHGVLPLGSRARLLLRTDAGFTQFAALNSLPASERFFAGGSRSVRGYAYESLGERNASGDVIGGRYLLVGSAEVDYRVYGNWGVAAFFDAGNASNNFPPTMKKGVGVGLRYASPVGMIRVDLAHPLDPPRVPVRLHISIGPDL